jgi:hypothetical protein
MQQEESCKILISISRSLNFESTHLMGKKKNPNAVALGKLGGSKGGKIRAQRLTAEQRKEIARKAVKARWAKAKNKNKQQ